MPARCAAPPACASSGLESAAIWPSERPPASLASLCRSTRRWIAFHVSSSLTLGLPSAHGGPWLQEYLATGYSEVAESTQPGVNGDLLYPILGRDGAPARWTGRVVLGKVGAVGELVRGTLEYRGKDAIGQERNVHAEFAVPKYPDQS